MSDLDKWVRENPTPVTMIETSNIPASVPTEDADDLKEYHPDPKVPARVKFVKGPAKDGRECMQFVFEDLNGWDAPTVGLLSQIEFIAGPANYKDLLVARPRIADGSLGNIDATWSLHYARVEPGLCNPDTETMTILQWYHPQVREYVYTSWKW